jgi:hypothetical protein
MDALLFFQHGGRLGAEALAYARLLLRALLAPAPAPRSATEAAAAAAWPPPPPRWALAFLTQGLLLPCALALLPPLALLQPPASAAAACALGLLHTALQLALTDWRDLAAHVLLGPRGAAAGFYDGPPGQRAKRVAVASIVGYAAYFGCYALGAPSGAAPFVAAGVAVAAPLLPAFAAATFLERGLEDATMRARVWEFWWAS